MSNDLKVLTVIIAALAIALVPVSAYEESTGLPTDLDIGDIIPDDDTVGPTGIINELKEAHSDISNIMIDHSNRDYSIADELVFTATYVDTESLELVVMLDPIVFSLGLHPDEGDIEDVLGTETLPIRLEYGVFIEEGHIRPSSQSQINSWISLYNTRCSSPTYNSLCEALAFNLGTQNHYVLDSNNMWHPPGTDLGHEEEDSDSDMGTIIFTDDFEDGMSKWSQTGNEDFEARISDENHRYPEAWNSTNKVAESENCDYICSIDLVDRIDLTPYTNATLTFDRFVDRSYDRGEYMKIELYDGSWDEIYNWSANDREDDDIWHSETFDLEDYMDVSELDIRITTRSTSPSEEGAVDNVMVTVFGGTTPQLPVDSDGDGINDSVDDCPTTVGLTQLSGCPDTTPPVISVPNDISGKPRVASLGFYTEFVVTATDNVDSMVVPECDEETGYFQVGVTTVTCTARDSAGNMATETFTITVTPKSSNDDGDECSDVSGQAGSSSDCPDDSENSTEFTLCYTDDDDEEVCHNVDPSNTDSLSINGGTPFTHIYNKTSGEREFIPNVGMITIGATKDGNDGFVTAAHTLVRPFSNTEFQFAGVADGMDMRLIADVEDGLNPSIYNRQIADSIFVPTYDNVDVSKNSIQMKNTTDIVSITSKGGLVDANNFIYVMLVGQNYDYQGRVTYKNVTIVDEWDGINFEQALATYNSTGGDSGGPIISIPEDGEATLYGHHVGLLCRFNPSDGAPLFPSPTLFPNTCLTEIRVITPWDNVVEHLGIQ